MPASLAFLSRSKPNLNRCCVHPHTGQDKALVYVCGPASMIDDAERTYLAEDKATARKPLRKEQLRFEKWW